MDAPPFQHVPAEQPRKDGEPMKESAALAEVKRKLTAAAEEEALKYLSDTGRHFDEETCAGLARELEERLRELSPPPQASIEVMAMTRDHTSITVTLLQWGWPIPGGDD